MDIIGDKKVDDLTQTLVKLMEMGLEILARYCAEYLACIISFP